jgi:glycosyltransferase involved in cell wall biosynthesis
MSLSIRRRLRVLCIVPSLRHGGAEMQVVNLANALDDKAFETHLLYYDEGEALRDRVDLAKVRLHSFRKKATIDFRLASAVARLIDEHEIDVVHCTLQYSLLVAWMARLIARNKPKLICAIHTTVNLNGYHELADRTLYRWLLRRCAAVVFVCESQRAHWVRKYPELAPIGHVVFNGVDTAFFDTAAATGVATTRAKLDVPADASVVSCIARFRPEKAHDLLVRAFAQASRDVRDSYLLLAGDGPTRDAVERLVAELGLQARVKFLGPVKDVRSLLAASDVTVLSSTAVETFSMAMLESMAMGVPLVATDMGGTREAVVEGETGLIVAPNDVDALARGLVRILADDALRASLGRNARALVEKRFTQDLMVRETAGIVEEAANAPG